MLRKAGIGAFVTSAIILASAYSARAQTASANDTARFLAGMPPSSASPLAPLTQDPAWQRHARYFNSAFGNLDKNQFAKIRAWSSAKLTAPSPGARTLTEARNPASTVAAIYPRLWSASRPSRPRMSRPRTG